MGVFGWLRSNRRAIGVQTCLGESVNRARFQNASAPSGLGHCLFPICGLYSWNERIKNYLLSCRKF